LLDDAGSSGAIFFSAGFAIKFRLGDPYDKPAPPPRQPPPRQPPPPMPEVEPLPS
jgi:hypothetical protein